MMVRRGLLLSVALAAVGCQKPPVAKSAQAHLVAVQEISVARAAVEVPVRGRVLRTHASPAEGALKGISSYRVEVAIPSGTEANLVSGQSVRVSLPTIHHSEVQARVDRVGRERIELVLADQVQELAGREVRVQIPLKARGLFRLPFTSVYSPRGLSKQVFLLKGDRVQTAAIEVVGIAGKEELWVVGALAPNDRVVTRGLDNLVSGELVRVISSEGVLQ